MRKKCSRSEPICSARRQECSAFLWRVSRSRTKQCLPCQTCGHHSERAQTRLGTIPDTSQYQYQPGQVLSHAGHSFWINLCNPFIHVVRCVERVGTPRGQEGDGVECCSQYYSRHQSRTCLFRGGLEWFPLLLATNKNRSMANVDDAGVKLENVSTRKTCRKTMAFAIVSFFSAEKTDVEAALH